MNPTLLLLLLVFSSRFAEALSSPLQTTSPIGVTPIVWDLPSVTTVIGALIATLVLVFLFVMLLRRFTHLEQESPSSRCGAGATNGIHPQILHKFPIFSYSSSILKIQQQQQDFPPQCAVCLADFNHGDTLRLLPQCNHVFHSSCIDIWLSSHVSCPVCRAYLNQLQQSYNSILHIVIPDEQGGKRNGCDEEEEEENALQSAKKKLLLRSNSTGQLDVNRYCCKCNMMQRSASYNILDRVVVE